MLTLPAMPSHFKKRSFWFFIPLLLIVAAVLPWVIQADRVQAQAVVVADTDSDGMDDGWETTHFGDLSHDGTADTDSDTLADAFEFEAGLNPNVADTDGDGNEDWVGVPGYLSVEKWDNIAGFSLDDLIADNAFYGQPSEEYFTPHAKTITGSADSYGVRMRGTIIAPYTGEYRFWVSGDDDCELLLSTDHRKFNKRKIAWVEGWTWEEQWDLYASQRSQLVELVAGQEYYIEVLLKEGGGGDHLAVAWEYFEQARQVIPGSALRSYVPDPDDQDDDGMPDSWELQVGLDPNDNGQTNIDQRAYSDIDGDGILNWLEFQYGGNPFVVGGNKGYLEFDVWTGIGGAQVDDLVYHAKYAGPADERSWVAANVVNWAESYGGRMRGTVKAPVTGDYTFWVAGDDGVELWLSDTADRFSKRKIAYYTGWTNYQQWDKSSTQRSASVRLQAGQEYYIEALVKEYGGADHLSIGWDYIPAADWINESVGETVTSSWSEVDGVVHVTADGGDIWSDNDTFAYRTRQLTGDGVITARIKSMNNPHEWAKVGLMMRESLAVNSKHVSSCRSGSGNIQYMARSGTGGSTISVHTDAAMLADWLRLERVGDVFRGYYSEDGMNWTLLSEQTVAMPETIYVGLFATDNIVSDPVVAEIEKISISRLSQTKVIPSSALTSILPHPNDLDDDNLPDDWENQMGLDASTAANSQGQYGDPDGDYVNNYQEYLLGTNPLEAGGIPGYLMREVWYGLGGGHINDLIGTNKFLQPADLVEAMPTSEAPSNHAENYGQRIRGRVVAPVAGHYRFWIAGDDASELWLSSDARKFNKRRIAWLKRDGIFDELVDFGWTGPREWDRYLTQRSESIYLEAGQEYFIEILHKEDGGADHLAVAWQYTDASSGLAIVRELIPDLQLRSFSQDADDADDDYLPDSWENFVGLNTSDNGLTDNREGEYGDYDGDLLTNREEWLQGTDPTKADTDGDGVGDYAELHSYGSDPTRVDIGSHTLVQNVELSSYVSPSNNWYYNADGSISSSSRRGEVSFPLSVSSAGVHIIELTGRARGSLEDVEELPIVIYIDGIRLGSYTLYSVDGGQGKVVAITPWLSEGEHSVTVIHDNHIARRRLQIDAVRLLIPSGIDENNDGISDWIGNQLIAENAVTVCPEESYVSPVCIEGKARHFEQVAITSNGQIVPALRALEENWYANVDLLSPLPDEQVVPTVIDFTFEGGNLSSQQTVTWKETDVLAVGDMTIRKGDSLRLTGIAGINKNPQSIHVTLTIDDVEVATDFKAANPHVYTFNTPGEHVVAVYCRHGNTKLNGSMVVTVLDAEFGDPFEVFANRPRDWKIPNVGAEIFVEPDPRLGFVELTAPAEGGRLFRVDPFKPVERRVLARTEENGAILGYGVVEGYQVYSTSETGDMSFTETYPNGDSTVQMSVVAPDLPEGGYILLEIFVAGVTFLDGTTSKILTSEDFDVNGISYVQFNFPAGTQTSVCHRLYLYDAEGNRLGVR